MKLILKLAWRSILRNWRRSLLTILAIFFAVFLSVVMRGVQNGTYENNIRMAASIFTGYMQIQREGYNDNPSLLKSFEYNEEINNFLSSKKTTISYTPRINGFGLAGKGEKSFGVALFGIEPDQEKKVTTLHTKIEEGKFLSKDRKYDIIVGKTLLKNLDAQLGDTLVVLTSGFDGAMGNLKFRISGVSKMGSREFDAMSIFMTLDAARELMAMNQRITSIAITLDDINDLDLVKKRISEYLDKNEISGKKLTVLDWSDLMPEMKQSIELDDISGLLFLAILIVVVGFGILNTLTMSITERFREFGVMLALGTNHNTLLRIVMWETVILTIIGIFVGSLMGFLVNLYIYLNPIALGGEIAELTREFGFEPKVWSSIELSILFNNAIIILITAFVAFIYPAWKVIKLEALKGIRYT
jgi:ABC-type lipoprotein release transport system permease subunit